MTHTRFNIMRQCYDSMLELVRPEHGKLASHTFESDTESRADEMEDVDELLSGSEANHSGGNSSDEDSTPITTRSCRTITSNSLGKKRRWTLTTSTPSTSKKSLYGSPKSLKTSGLNNRKFARKAVLSIGNK